MVKEEISRTTNESEEKMKNYITEMKKRHEAFKNYGLDFDFNLWIEFNRECLIREIAENITIEELNEMSDFFEISGLQNYDYIEPASRMWHYQRLIAEFKLKKMIKMGMINKLNYLKVEV